MKGCQHTILLLWLTLSSSQLLANQEQIQREMVETLEAYAVYKMGQYEAAFAQWQVLAEKGNPHGILNIANMYQAGLGVEQDLAQAVYWYRQGAAQGDPLAIVQLAKVYAQGLGVTADPEQADQLYQQAAEAGSIEAQHHLAQQLLQRGETAAAQRWLQRAADQGDWAAQSQLAKLQADAPAAAAVVTPQQREHILSLLNELDDAASTRDAVRLTQALAADAHISVRLPGQTEFQTLSPAEYQALWQATFEQTDRYRFHRVGFTATATPAQPIVVHSQIQEHLIQPEHIQKLQLTETLHLILTTDSPVIQGLRLEVQTIPE